MYTSRRSEWTQPAVVKEIYSWIHHPCRDGPVNVELSLHLCRGRSALFRISHSNTRTEFFHLSLFPHSCQGHFSFSDSSRPRYLIILTWTRLYLPSHLPASAHSFKMLLWRPDVAPIRHPLHPRRISCDRLRVRCNQPATEAQCTTAHARDPHQTFRRCCSTIASSIWVWVSFLR